MRRILVVSTPAILEARNLAAWITRERIPGVTIAPSKGEWGVFAPARFAARARRAFRKVVAAANPGGFRVYFKLRHQDKYKPMRRTFTFGRATKIADGLVRRMALKAAVLDRRGSVRFVAFKRGRGAASNPGMDALADAAVVMAARGARQYLDVHKLSADPAALTACLKSWVKIKFPEALKDASAAISAGMHQMAEATFAATMKMAGIEAAKEAARPPSAGKNQPHTPRFYQDSIGKIHDWNTGAIVTLPVSPVVVMSYRTKPPSLFKTWRAGGERHWDYLGTRAGRNPRRKARARASRNGPYYYTPKYRPPMVGAVPAGFTLVEAPQIGRWRQDLPVSSYRFGVISYHEALSDDQMTRYELAYATPRAGRNPRRARRNARPYKRTRARRNASIESQWPRMREAQRASALRIVGIDRDVADTWAYKDWHDLSSVVKVLLARSWKHGGNTTRIRRAPVVVR